MIVRPRCYQVTWRTPDGSGHYCTCWDTTPTDDEARAIALASSFGTATIEAGRGALTISVTRTYCSIGAPSRVHRAAAQGRVDRDPDMYRLPRSVA